VAARVLLVEDDPDLAQALALELRHHGHEVQAERDGPGAMRASREWHPDLVLLDLGLPSLDGIEVCRRLRDASRTPIIIITAREAVGDRVRGLDAGADDYLAKPFSLDELMARVRAALRRSHLEHQGSEVRIGDLHLDTDARVATWSGTELKLTRREFDLLDCLMRHSGVVLSRERLLSTVWGYEFMGGSNTVDVYISYLRRKLDAVGAPRLIQTVRGIGYALRPR
jgi:two-component system response regulator MprA